MAGPNSSSRVTVEVLVKENQIAPMWVGLELFEISEHRPATSLVLEKYACHPARQFARYLPQGHHLSRSSRELDFEVVADVVVKFLQRLDQQVVRRKPDRAAPVGVATKQPCRGFARLIVHAVLIAVHMQGIRIVAVKLRQRTNRSEERRVGKE